MLSESLLHIAANIQVTHLQLKKLLISRHNFYVNQK